MSGESKKKRGITIRLGASYHDLSVNGDTPVDLSSTTQFTSRGNVHGLIRPTKDSDRASSMIVHHLQKRGMFAKKVQENASV